jgi:hypothetical protein
MKTKRISFKTGSLLSIIMTAVLALTILGCEKEDPLFTGQSFTPETTYSGNIMTETFWVSPEGTNVDLFNGDVSLEFPE